MKILFITATRIGDAVLATGVLNRLAEQYPAARFTIACGQPAAPLLQPFPRLERLIVMRKQRLSGHWLALWAACIGAHWDLVVDLRGSALAWLVLARQRVVWRTQEVGHRVEDLAAMFGFKPPPAPTLWTLPEHEQRAATLIPAGGPVLAIGPTANWRGKEWRAQSFIALIERLTAPGGLLPGARVALFGAKDERPAAEPVVHSVPENRRIDLVGTADLPTVAAALRRCSLYIGNDSGLMHIAAAVGTPTLGLFGPGNEGRYGPWGARTAVVRTSLAPHDLMGPGFDHLRTGSLMDSLTVESVEKAAAQLYARVRGNAA
jgi:ADP-heptose:LPS heptosyltransferase